MTRRTGGDQGAGGPLSGIRVVDLTTNVLGPQSTQILGDMGADVIKIERPGGDPTRQNGVARHAGMGPFFLAINRNKRSVLLDLKRPECVEALLDLAERADVFVHSMRERAAQRLGIGYEAIAARNPGIVYAAACGYRRDGPRAERPAYDDMIQGESGVAALNRPPDGEPRYFPMPFVDKFVGYVQASAITMALFHRERTGRGQRVSVPMYETMLAFNFAEHLAGETFVPPTAPLGYARTLSPWRKPYRTLDGHVCLLANSDAQWLRMFDAMETPELATDARFSSVGARSRNVDALYERVAQAMACRSTADWLRLLAAADVPCARFKELRDVLEDPYVAETGFFQQVEHPSEGRIRSPHIPTQFSDSPPSVRRLAPRLGEHTAEILAELGYSEERAARVMAAAPAVPPPGR